MADESEGTPTPDPTEDPGNEATVETLQAENEKIRAALKAANKEAADRRKRLDALEAEEQARRTAEMTEQQKLQARAEAAEQALATAQARADETLIRAAYVAEAAKAGATHPEDVYLLASREGVMLSDDGIRVLGVAESVQALLDEGRIPLAGRTPAPKMDGGAGGGGRAKPIKLDENEMRAARAAGMTPEEYAALRDATTQDA